MAHEIEQQPSATELAHQLRTEQKKLALVQDIGKALSGALELDQLLGLIMEKVTILMEADRSTLYLLSDDGTELWSKVAQSGGELLEIRLKVGEGIAGWVGQSGETVNIPDAYTDNRFQPRVDLSSGYRTKSILCVPARDRTGKIVGVLQVLNKQDGPFTEDDEQLLIALSGQAAVSIENHRLLLSVIEARDKLQKRNRDLDVLYEVERDITASDDFDELLERLVKRTMDMVGAEAGSIALVPAGSTQLRFRTAVGSAAERLRGSSISVGEGVIGWVTKNREAIIVNDPVTDRRHATEFTAALGAPSPRHLLCAPLISHDVVVGAIELVNKRDREDGFTKSDLHLLILIAGQVSRAIQIAQAKEERENEDRLAAIGSMLAGVLHDLKTPMTIISGYAQLMAQMEEAEKRETYVHQILHQFDLMSGMTREVMAFARGESNVLIRRVYMHRFLDTVTTQLKHSLGGRNVTVELDAGYTGAAYFDENSMLRLVHNLARNAADAMPSGGTFRICTSEQDGVMQFKFRDTGDGIPKELEGRLFEMFASRKQGGTGLGLAIVKKIVDDHRGQIRYESSENGTTFYVQLPLSRPPSAAETTGEAPALG